MKKFNYLLFGVFLISICFFIGGCTSDKPTDTGVDEKGPLEVTSRLRAEPNGIRPLMATTTHELQLVQKIFPSLVQYDPFTFKLTPMLAKALPEMTALKAGEYDGDADYKYSFEILDEAVWDNGEPVLASDYLFTLKVLFNPHVTGAVPYRGALHFIKDLKIDPDNPKKMDVYVKGVFRTRLGSGFYILPEHIYDPEKIMRNFELRELTQADLLKKVETDERLKAFGDAYMDAKYSHETVESCGPYKLVAWNAEQEIILEKKENWWGEKLVNKYPLLTAKPEKLIFKFIADETATISALKGGQIDIAGKLTPTGFLDFKNGNLADKFNFYTPDMLLYMYMALNTKRPKLSDKRVRRAIAHLVNVDEIIESVQLNFATPVVTPILKSSNSYHKDLKRILLDVDKAKALLAEAGWKDTNGDGVVDKMIDGKREEMVIKVIFGGTATTKAIISLVAEDAIKAGVKIEEDVVDERTLFRGRMAKRDYDASLSAIGFDEEEFDPHGIWHTDSDQPNGRNRTGFGNAESDAIIDEIRTTEDADRRKELYLRLQEIIYDEQPFVFLYYTKDRIITSNRFQKIETSFRHPGYFENYFEY